MTIGTMAHTCLVSTASTLRCLHFLQLNIPLQLLHILFLSAKQHQLKHNSQDQHGTRVHHNKVQKPHWVLMVKKIANYWRSYNLTSESTCKYNWRNDAGLLSESFAGIQSIWQKISKSQTKEESPNPKWDLSHFQHWCHHNCSTQSNQGIYNHQNVHFDKFGKHNWDTNADKHWDQICSDQITGISCSPLQRVNSERNSKSTKCLIICKSKKWK